MQFLNRSKSSNDSLVENRKRFLHDFCDTCKQSVGLNGCGSTFRSMLEPIYCPATLTDSHVICPFCLDLHPRVQHHNEYCVFAQKDLQLRAGGWSTSLSNDLLRAIRYSTSFYYNPLVNLIRILLLELEVENATVVPIPMGSLGKTDIWLEMVRAASMNVGKVEVTPLLVRKKQQSVRKNVAQVRERIVQQEFEIDPELLGYARHRSVILLDDNVTTGKTIMHCASLLEQIEPREIIPLTVERHVSIRLLQRCVSPVVEMCLCYAPKT